MIIQSASVTIVTRQLSETRRFYETNFDARAVFDCGWYVVLRLGESGPGPEVCLMEPKEGMRPFAGGAFLNLKVINADQVHARLTGAGASSAIPLEDHPWGDRGFGVLDPSGTMVYCYHPIAPDPEFARCVIKSN
jgi:catechol 2,3-dioxygenase-like lactoylglutathione lyase family enzyme